MRICNDVLYGPLSFSEDDWELFQTKELTRLRDVTFSAVPNYLEPSSAIDSRFNHSLGVAHLVKVLCKAKKEFRPYFKNLYLAALFHEVGFPPFPHIGDHFLYAKTNKGHEDNAFDILKNSKTKFLIKKQGGNFKEIINIIKGKGKLGSLMNGTIDIDNIDNTLRWGLQVGIIKKIYDPEKLVLIFSLGKNSEIYLDRKYKKELEKWEECREKVYHSGVHVEGHISVSMMIFRALEFAFIKGELKDEFFTLTDTEALNYLKKCNKKTREIVSDALSWNFYKLVAEKITTSPSLRFRQLCSGWEGRKELADFVAKKLKISKEKVCVYTGKDKGWKKIDLKIKKGNNSERHNPPPLRWLIQVFIHPKFVDKKKIIKKAVIECLAQKADKAKIRDIDLW